MPEPRRRDRGRPRADACPGAWRRHDASDGALARFRPVGGAVSAPELRVLAGAAMTGGAPLEITSRGSVQVRGLDPRTADDLADALRSDRPGALLDPQGRDVPCSVVASPRSGALDAAARAVAAGLRERAGIPGRLLVALDDGSGDVAAAGADVTVVGSGEGTGGDGTGGDGTGGDGTGGARLLLDGVDTGLRHDDPAALALAAVDTFLAVRGTSWRLAEVDDGVARVAAGVRDRLVPDDDPAGDRRRADDRRTDDELCAPRPDPRRFGDHAGGPRLGLDPVSGVLEVLPRLGELDAATVGVLAALPGPQGEALPGPEGGALPGPEGGAPTLRITPWRTLVLRDLADPAAALDRLAAHVETDPASRWAGLSACVGAPRCAKSLTDVRGDLADAVAADRAGGGQVRAHWIGCHRACGTPGGRVAVVEALATGGYRSVVRAGRVTR